MLGDDDDENEREKKKEEEGTGTSESETDEIRVHGRRERAIKRKLVYEESVGELVLVK